MRWVDYQTITGQPLITMPVVLTYNDSLQYNELEYADSQANTDIVMSSCPIIMFEFIY